MTEAVEREGKRKIVRDAFYYDTVVFQVENTLFRLPRQKIANESETFRELLSQPAQGSSDEEPIKLKRVTVADFRSFLAVLFPAPRNREYNRPVSKSTEEWKSVFELASRWRFASIRAVAVRELEPKIEGQKNAIAWVLLARRCNVRSWLVYALTGLVKREQPLDAKDIDSLGVSTFMALMKLREEYLKLSVEAKSRSRHRSELEEALKDASARIQGSVRRQFSDELVKLDKASAAGEFGPLDDGLTKRRKRKAEGAPEAGSKSMKLEQEALLVEM
ncbi:uncharacterized protein BXZ73DRAFT_41670 [Epithele typhae]|uniref:uncharacterized protein n=1 Tax=Epithele typhae TaxID=378194 RepID=UPI0020082B75|nr:uncharacterized protein BXZ73DRAFT_41670 [Epithele typhae]KAH9941619.1 hypothetical protein BXZ73DRAFT_41670 [Epithele typhae]